MVQARAGYTVRWEIYIKLELQKLHINYGTLCDKLL